MKRHLIFLYYTVSDLATGVTLEALAMKSSYKNPVIVDLTL
jgi:hypothetical protein